MSRIGLLQDDGMLPMVSESDYRRRNVGRRGESGYEIPTSWCNRGWSTGKSLTEDRRVGCPIVVGLIRRLALKQFSEINTT